MAIFNNAMGFRPEGKVLKLWTLLPQITTTIDGEEIPSLLGNLKNIGLYYLMVGILILAELALIFLLVDEGVPWMALLVLSLIDFVIAIIPFLWELKPQYNKSYIKASIFIDQTKLKIPSKTPSHLNEQQYKEQVFWNLKKNRSLRKQIRLINCLFAGLIGFSAIGKFVTYWAVFDTDIFIEGSGRLILATIVLSVIVHISSTRVVLYHILFSINLNSQLKLFQNDNQYKIRDADTNKKYPLNYLVPYKPVIVDNQKICQQVSLGTVSPGVIDIRTSAIHESFRIDLINGNSDVFLIYTGLLLEPEISKLFSAQGDEGARRAIVASGKEIQIAQIIQ